MKKNLLNELDQMKFMFGYKPGKVLSEQNYINESDIDFTELDVDDILMAEPDVMEPDTETETRPKTRPGKPDRDPFPNPFDPDRSREFDPLPDAEPQGRRRESLRMIPSLRSTEESEVNEPYTQDVDEYSSDIDLETLVNKYLRGKKDEEEIVYEIHLNGDISELFDL